MEIHTQKCGSKNIFPHKRHLRSTHNKITNILHIKPVKTQAAHDLADYHRESLRKIDYGNIIRNMLTKINLEFGFKNTFPHKRDLRSTHNKNTNILQIKIVTTRAAHDMEIHTQK